MKKWIAKKLIGLLVFEWRTNNTHGGIEITVKLGGTNLLLLRAIFDGEKFYWEEY